MLVSLWFVWILDPYVLGAGEVSRVMSACYCCAWWKVMQSHVSLSLLFMMEGDDGLVLFQVALMTALNSVLFWFLLELTEYWFTFMLLYRYFCKSHRCVAVQRPWRWSFMTVVSFKLLLNCLSCVVLLVTSWQLHPSLHVAAEESPIEYSCMNSLHSLWSGSQKRHQLKACEGFWNWVLITFLCSCGGGSIIWIRMSWAANAVSLSCHLLIYICKHEVEFF
jgi:hypothetical protein